MEATIYKEVGFQLMWKKESVILGFSKKEKTFRFGSPSKISVDHFHGFEKIQKERRDEISNEETDCQGGSLK